jgi:hypothetical protein
LTNNIAVQGANGRDQAAAFGASSWIHFYFIWNGTTLATLSSLTAPPTGPTLPSGYTHWAYATTIRYNATPALVSSYVRGSWVLTRALTVLVAASGPGTIPETVVDVSAAVPPNASAYHLVATMYMNADATAGGSTATAFNLRLRLVTGVDYALIRSACNNNVYSGGGAGVIVPNVGQAFRYMLDTDLTATVNNKNVRIDCLGYRVPTGD